MRTVFFDDKNSYKDFLLILSKKTIGAPSPKLNLVELQGADGSLDYTEYFGEVHYCNRALKFEFSMIGNPKNFLEQFSKILNSLNGRKMRISLSDDEEYYYVGRVTVNEWESERNIGKVVIDVEAEPYKLKKAVTVLSVAASEKTVLNCKNERMKVQPVLTFTGETAITFDGIRTVFKAGSYMSDDIVFNEGENVLTIEPLNGETLVTIEYQEGKL